MSISNTFISYRQYLYSKTLNKIRIKLEFIEIDTSDHAVDEEKCVCIVLLLFSFFVCLLVFSKSNILNTIGMGTVPNLNRSNAIIKTCKDILQFEFRILTNKASGCRCYLHYTFE